MQESVVVKILHIEMAAGLPFLPTWYKRGRPVLQFPGRVGNQSPDRFPQTSVIDTGEPHSSLTSTLFFSVGRNRGVLLA